jgi:nucleotide-binding universal stress UspA family protein
MNGTVVVGVDGTPADLDALDAATDEALRRSSTLLIAHASDVSSPGTEPAAVMNAAARARGRSKSLRIKTCSEAGPARPCLVRLSGSAALLVVGSSESSGLVGLLTGSVSAYVAAHARCPVLVVPADSALTQAPESPGTIVVGVSPDRAAEASIDFAVENATLRHVRCSSTRSARSSLSPHRMRLRTEYFLSALRIGLSDATWTTPLAVRSQQGWTFIGTPLSGGRGAFFGVSLVALGGGSSAGRYGSTLVPRTLIADGRGAVRAGGRSCPGEERVR